MSVKEKVNFLSSIDMKELFKDILYEGDYEDLEKFIRFSKEHMNEIMTKKHRNGHHNISADFDNKNVIEFLLENNQPEKLMVIIDLLLSREEIFGFDTKKIKSAYGNDDWYSIYFMELMISNDMIEVFKKMNQYHYSLYDKMAGFVFKNASEEMFDLLIRERAFSIRNSMGINHGLDSIIGEILETQDNPVYQNRIKKMLRNNHFGQEFLTHLILKVLNGQPVESIKYIFSYADMKAKYFTSRDGKCNIIDLMIKNDKIPYLKMLLEENIIAWDYQDKEGKSIEDSIDQYIENAGRVNLFFLNEIKKFVTIKKEQSNLNEILNQSAEPKKTTRL